MIVKRDDSKALALIMAIFLIRTCKASWIFLCTFFAVKCHRLQNIKPFFEIFVLKEQRKTAIFAKILLIRDHQWSRNYTRNKDFTVYFLYKLSSICAVKAENLKLQIGKDVNSYNIWIWFFLLYVNFLSLCIKKSPRHCFFPIAVMIISMLILKSKIQVEKKILFFFRERFFANAKDFSISSTVLSMFIYLKN